MRSEGDLMFSKPAVWLLGSLVLSIAVRVSGQAPTAKPSADQAPPPALRKLSDADEKQANQLAGQLTNAVKAGRWDEAIARSEELLGLRTRLQGPKHFETVTAELWLKTMRGVASMSQDDRAAYQSADLAEEQALKLQSVGKYAQAEPLFEKALEVRRRLLTDNHVFTALSYAWLGWSVNAQGKYAQARPLLEKALEIRRRLLTDDHPDTAKSYNNVAINLSSFGKYAQAQALFEKALEIRRRLLTDNHPETAASYSNFAYNLNTQGKYAQAQPLAEQALEIRRRLFTDDHPQTATSYNNVAANLNDQGKYAQAQPLFERALEIRRRLLTDDHPDTAASYNNLAHNLNAQGQYGQAQPLYEKALEIRRRLFTDDHPDTAVSYNNVAANLRAQGRYAQAQPLFEKALEIFRRLRTDDHPETAASYNNVAANLNDQGKYAQAQPLYEKSLEIRRRLLTDDHPDTAQGYNNVAANLNAQGKYAQAQQLHEKALEIRRRLLTDDHPDTAFSYDSAAYNLWKQGKYAQAQPLYEKALEIRRRLLTDDHPDTATSYHGVAASLRAQGKYAQAQPLNEKALEITRRLLTDDHPDTAASYGNVADTLHAQGKYPEAKQRWMSAVKSLDAARLLVAFTGLERAGAERSVRPALAAVLARLGEPSDAWQAMEDDLGRGLLDELAARQDRRLAAAERARLRALTNELEKLDKLVESSPKELDKAQRAKRFEELKRQRELASIALGEFRTKLVAEHKALAGQVAKLNEIQAALPADLALLAWVDLPPSGPNAADPDGEHWGVVVRSRGTPVWVPISGTGPNGLWTKDDNELASRVRAELRSRPGAGRGDSRPLAERSRTQAEPQPLVDKLRIQRLEPLSKALGASANGQPPARRLIVLPSPAMAGIPIEVLLAPDDTRTVSYAPSATVFKYLREQPRPDRHAGLLALGDPVYERHDGSSEPKPLPDHGLLVNMVAPGSNAATHGLKPGDVLLAYNGTTLHKREDLRAVPEPGQPVPVEVWRAGEVAKRELAPGKLGVVLDTRPAPVAIAELRKLQQVLVAARSGGDDEFAPLPGTRYEVEALARLFKSDDRPTQTLLGVDASEEELEHLAASGDLGRYGFIHLATHGVIDEDLPTRSAVILTQTGLPDPLQQALSNKPVFDGRLSVREIQRGWELKAEMVTLSACETALGRAAGGEGFVGFTQALLMSGARSVCLSLWKVDDTATALLMQRFYANLLGHRLALSGPMPKAEALREAKTWLRELRRPQVLAAAAELSAGTERGKGANARKSSDRGETRPLLVPSQVGADERPYAAPYYWAAFVLVGDPD
jgi:tetratricopeptide (TPR) repeat protein